VEDFTVDRTIALKENLHCRKCGAWIYCPEMNMKCKNDQGEDEIASSLSLLAMRFERCSI